jgi:hypothetical protein
MKNNCIEKISVDCLVVKNGSHRELDLFHYSCVSTKEHIGFGYEFGIVHFTEKSYKLHQPFEVIVNNINYMN